MMTIFFAYFAIMARFSHVSVYAPELVIDNSAFAYHCGNIEMIWSLGNDDWYSFLFVGTKNGNEVRGVIYGINTWSNPPSDMLDAPIPFWYTYKQSGRAVGKIDFRGHWRKLRLSPAEG